MNPAMTAALFDTGAGPNAALGRAGSNLIIAGDSGVASVVSSSRAIAWRQDQLPGKALRALRVSGDRCLLLREEPGFDHFVNLDPHTGAVRWTRSRASRARREVRN